MAMGALTPKPGKDTLTVSRFSKAKIIAAATNRTIIVKLILSIEHLLSGGVTLAAIVAYSSGVTTAFL
jgi:hypothetical protein